MIVCSLEFLELSVLKVCVQLGEVEGLLGCDGSFLPISRQILYCGGQDA